MYTLNPKIKLAGFNNLTKSLSFSIYNISWTQSPEHRQAYIKYIDQQFNADRLTDILQDVCQIIGANILNIARQDYDPRGASVTIMVAEKPLAKSELDTSEKPGPIPESVVSHLDKSHICVHTYPESHPENGISSFRADIEVSTCGLVSPLKALNFLIHSFDAAVATLDYRVRGFTRDVDGTKHYIDHEINSIQNFMSTDIHQHYEMIDVNVFQENIFHTKMIKNQFKLDEYLFGIGSDSLDEREFQLATRSLKREMQEIFYGRNMPNKDD